MWTFISRNTSEPSEVFRKHRYMKNSKIVLYIQQLSKEQLKRFQRFVASPYFNQHEKTMELLGFIVKQKESAKPIFEREKVAKILFPKEKQAVLYLNNSMTYLMRLLKKFLAYEALEMQTENIQLKTLEMALANKQLKLFELDSRQLGKQLIKSENKDRKFFKYQYELSQLLDDYEQTYGDRTSPKNLQQTLNFLDVYYFAEKLRHACHALARQNVVGGFFQLDFLEEMVEYLEKHAQKWLEFPPIAIYYQIYQLLKFPEEIRHYRKLKKMLSQYRSFFSKKEGRDLYRYAENYCILNINRGQTQYVQELFELFQQLLETDILLIGNYLHQWDYSNIIALGCRLKHFEWTENFIHEYREKLEANIQTNAYTYNLAFFYYEKKEYEAALALLNDVEFTDIYYQLNSKVLLLKSWFETENWRALDYSLDTFRIYLLRNKFISKDRQKGGFNLIKFTRKLFLLKEKQDFIKTTLFQKKINTLKEKLEACENVMSKQWLLSKCN